MRATPTRNATTAMTWASSSSARLLFASALTIVLFAWVSTLVAVATRETRLAARALYFAELATQRRAVVAPAEPPTVESIATQVHRRTTRQLGWIGGGLALCALAALGARWRPAAVVASCALYVGGWLLLEGYVDLGLLQGLDLKMRLIRGEPDRWFDFLVFDLLLPSVVATTGLAVLVTGVRLRRR